LITCNQHDYVEIACTYRFLIRLVMKEGGSIVGTALDTGLNDNRKECIKLDVDGVETWVVLDLVSRLDVLVENPHFKNVRFD